MTRVVIVGEAMLEMSHPDGATTRLAFGGDTLNTALYLARLGHAPHYVTALGTDPYSQGLIREWERECIQTLHVLRHPTRMPGIYAVQTDHVGERSFYYWRDTSAARAFFELGGAMNAIAFAAGADWLYLSGITLSIFTEAERATLVHLAERVRGNGGEVVFDPNYRPRGWADVETARSAIAQFGRHVSIAMPTIEDENALWGQKTGAEHARRWLDEGANAVILKCGPQGAIIYDNDHEPRRVPVPETVKPIDTTGAGDSFNAACLSGLILGLPLEQAADCGNRLAARVIRHHGAIIPREAMPGPVAP